MRAFGRTSGHRRAPRRGYFPRLAVIGCGGAAADRHLPALAKLGWRPQVLVDPRTDRAAALARRYRVPAVAGAAAELAGEVEAALIATNAAAHARVALPLLERGVHVFVEKPLATSPADAQAMVRAAAARSVTLTVGHLRRFLFVNRWVKALLDRGALGEITGLDVREGEDYHRPTGGRLAAVRAAAGTGPYSPAFWDAGSAGGGVLADLGCHALDLLLWWFGAARLVSYRDDSLGGVEGEARLEVALPNGAAGVLELSRSRVLRNTAIVTGSRGRIEVALHRNAVAAADPPSLTAFELDGRAGAAMPAERLHEDLFERELRDWLGALRSGREPFVTGASAAPAVALMADAYRNRRPLPRPWTVPRRAARGDVARGGLLRGRRVLVTGASGFIGGRLVERLVLEEGAQVRAAVRTFRRAARVARFPAAAVDLRRFDLADRNGPAAADRLVEGCDTVFHLARDIRAPAANEAGVRALAGACIRAGVRRLVHVSSLAVYEPLPDAPLTETSPSGRQPDNDKFMAQRELMRMVRAGGIDAAIIQPTIVYGPFSGYWTDRPAAMLRAGVVALPAPGDGICNAVYVDDVIRALFLAAVRDEAAGEAFLISGAEHPTWRQFYRACAQALARSGAVRLLAYEEIERRNRRRERRAALPTPKRVLGWRPLRPLRDALRQAVYRRPGARGRAAAKSDELLLPPKRLLDLYAARCPVRIDKARRLLGYEPEFGLERGMALTARYLEWAHPSDGRYRPHPPDRPV